jgi:hypothetical protein
MIARSTAQRLTDVATTPLLSLKPHQRQAIDAVFGQQSANSKSTVSDRADGMSKVTVRVYVGECHTPPRLPNVPRTYPHPKSLGGAP